MKSLADIIIQGCW